MAPNQVHTVRIWRRIAGWMVLASALPLAAAAQGAGGFDWQGYTVHSTLDFGGRWSELSGNPGNYQTMVNLHSGARLFDFTFGMSAPAGKARWFDTLRLDGFGFGGDPDTVARLDVAKTNLYTFQATFRQHLYYFDYNLLANPLNPAASTPALAVTTPLHQLHFNRSMGDYNLTLAPESKFRVRLGYSHLSEGGPALTTVGAAMAPGVGEVGIATSLVEDYRTTTDLYRAGADYYFLPRTRVSFTEIVQHTKGDTALEDQNYFYQLASGTPVDLGTVFNTPGGSPCPAPVASAGTTPPTANPSCQGLLTYSGDNGPRVTMPTEQLTFESGYFRNLTVDGIASYSSGSERSPATQANWTGLNTRTASASDQDLGNGSAKRVLVDGDLGAVYQITAKFRLTNDASYNSFRLPSDMGFVVGNGFFPLTGGATLANTPVGFAAATCPAPYTAATCPQHSSSSPADTATGYTLNYLGQNLGLETVQLGYEFSPDYTVHVGYRYSYRAIYDAAAIDYTAETFDPGGASGALAAARGDCALPKGGTFPASLPAGCALQPDGAVVFSGLTPTSDAAHGLAAQIHGNSGLASAFLRPLANLTLNLGIEVYSGDHAYTRITPRQSQQYTARVSYQPAAWAQISGNANDIEGSDNAAEDRFREHDRNFGFATTLTPGPNVLFDLGYNYSDIYNQAVVCYADSAQPAASTTPCPIAGSPVAIGSLSTYASKSHFVNADLRVQPVSQLTLRLGMASSFVHGTPLFFNLNGVALGNFLNPLTPFGPLQFNYQQPYVDVTWAMNDTVAYNLHWARYLYTTHGDQAPAGLAPLGPQNFDADTLNFSLRWTR